MGTVTRSGARLSLVLVSVALGSVARAETADPVSKTVAISTFSIPTAYVGEPYEQQFDAIRGRPPYEWSIVEPASTIPPGLSMSTDGLLSGTPTEAGRYGLAIRHEDQDGRVSVQPLTLIVEPARPFCERPENQGTEACLGGCDCRGASAGGGANGALGLMAVAALWWIRRRDPARGGRETGARRARPLVRDREFG